MIGVLTLFLSVSVGGLAAAQTPNPTNYFEDWRPNNLHYPVNGVVVEGLGSINCSYSQLSIEQATVTSINSGHATITEITPQSYCGSLGQYETLFTNISSYVFAHAALAPTLWGGFMLDEEPAYNSYTTFNSLNVWLNGYMGTQPGISYIYSEIGPCNGGCYSQAQFNQLSYYAHPAPQVYNQNFANYANASGRNYQLVTWWSGSSYPWNSAAYAAAHISGAPYNEQFGTSNNFQWENTYQNQ